MSPIDIVSFAIYRTLQITKRHSLRAAGNATRSIVTVHLVFFSNESLRFRWGFQETFKTSKITYFWRVWSLSVSKILSHSLVTSTSKVSLLTFFYKLHQVASNFLEFHQVRYLHLLYFVNVSNVNFMICYFIPSSAFCRDSK